MIDNDTDLFRAAVEAKIRRETINEADKLQEKINVDNQEKKRKKSIARANISKRHKQSKKKFLIGFVTGVLAGSLATVGITGAYNKIEENQKAKSAFNNLRGQASVRLLEEGLAVRDDNGNITVLDNQISDYRCLDLTHSSLLEQHVYYDVLGYKEFDDAIQTASYEAGHYYIGTDQWRSINGFVNKNTNEPSLNEQYAAMKDDLVRAYETNCEGIIRTTDEIEQNNLQGRGY